MKVIVGTRGSQLALTQTKWVVSQLEKANPEHTFEIKIIKTKGDLIQNVALDKIGDKGVFVKEIEEQLLARQIDVAIHSMKDMPSEVTTGLHFVKVPKREDRRDVLVLRQGTINSLEDLREGAVIATGSKRRKYQLLQARPDLEIVPIRGNIDTRIRKITDENLDGVVLAAAGLHRVGFTEKIGYYLPEGIVVPAPAQGALGVQIRANDEAIYTLVKNIECERDDLEVQAERAFLKGVNGSCNIPIGACANWDGSVLEIQAILGDEAGNKLVRKQAKYDVQTAEEAYQAGLELAEMTLKELNYEG